MPGLISHTSTHTDLGEIFVGFGTSERRAKGVQVFNEMGLTHNPDNWGTSTSVYYDIKSLYPE